MISQTILDTIDNLLALARPSVLILGAVGLYVITRRTIYSALGRLGLAALDGSRAVLLAPFKLMLSAFGAISRGLAARRREREIVAAARRAAETAEERRRATAGDQDMRRALRDIEEFFDQKS